MKNIFSLSEEIFDKIKNLADSLQPLSVTETGTLTMHYSCYGDCSDTCDCSCSGGCNSCTGTCDGTITE